MIEKAHLFFFIIKTSDNCCMSVGILEAVKN